MTRREEFRAGAGEDFMKDSTRGYLAGGGGGKVLGNVAGVGNGESDRHNCNFEKVDEDWENSVEVKGLGRC